MRIGIGCYVSFKGQKHWLNDLLKKLSGYPQSLAKLTFIIRVESSNQSAWLACVYTIPLIMYGANPSPPPHTSWLPFFLFLVPGFLAEDQRTSGPTNL